MLDIFFGTHGYLCTMYVCLVIMKNTRYQVPWRWSYRSLWAAMWVLETEPRCSARSATGLNLWAILPAPGTLFLSHFVLQDSLSFNFWVNLPLPLTMEYRNCTGTPPHWNLSLSSWSSCFSLLNSGITDMCHHPWFLCGARYGSQGFVHAEPLLYQLSYIN